jgi:hypothetical protein
METFPFSGNKSIYIRRKIVDFPAPDGPVRKTKSPLLIVKLTFLMPAFFPNVQSTLIKEIIVSIKSWWNLITGLQFINAFLSRKRISFPFN